MVEKKWRHIKALSNPLAVPRGVERMQSANDVRS